MNLVPLVALAIQSRKKEDGTRHMHGIVVGWTHMPSRNHEICAVVLAENGLFYFRRAIHIQCKGFVEASEWAATTLPDPSVKPL